jgi:hypothetical protein
MLKNIFNLMKHSTKCYINGNDDGYTPDEFLNDIGYGGGKPDDNTQKKDTQNNNVDINKNSITKKDVENITKETILQSLSPKKEEKPDDIAEMKKQIEDLKKINLDKDEKIKTLATNINAINKNDNDEKINSNSATLVNMIRQDNLVPFQEEEDIKKVVDEIKKIQIANNIPDPTTAYKLLKASIINEKYEKERIANNKLEEEKKKQQAHINRIFGGTDIEEHKEEKIPEDPDELFETIKKEFKI